MPVAMKILIIFFIAIFLVYPLACFLDAGHFEVQEGECLIETILPYGINHTVGTTIISALLLFSILVLLKFRATIPSRISQSNFFLWPGLEVVSLIDQIYSRAIVDPQK